MRASQAGAGPSDNYARLRFSEPRAFFRALAVVGLVGVFAFAWIHRAADPDAIDPLWQRGIMIAACGFLLASTWLLRLRHVLYVTYAVFALFVVWILGLLVLNRFSQEYALALVVVSAGIAGTFQHRPHLLVFQIGTLAGIGVAALLVDEPRVNLLAYMSYAVIMMVLVYLAVASRLDLDLRRAQSEERFDLAARGSSDGLWDWDLRAGHVHFTPRFKAMLGLEPQEMADELEAWLDRIHPDDEARVRAALSPGSADRSEHVEAEYRVALPSGDWRWMRLRAAVVRDADGLPLRLAGSQADITERREAEERIVHDATHDALTGLPNRALLTDRIGRLMAAGRRRAESNFAVLFIDLDRFKRVNDSLGHAAGDTLLRAVVHRLDSCLREEDTLARLVGDEFVVLAPSITQPDAALAVAERLQHALEDPFELDDHRIHLRASVGVAMGTGAYGDPTELIRDADIAMYRSKQKRLGRPELFDREMRGQAAHRLRLESQLRTGLREGQLELHYQPIVSFSDRSVTGFEALVRWRHPDRGLLAPREFLPLAEETGFIVDIGRWALAEACAAQSRWRAELCATPHVHVNLSAAHFLAGTVLEDVRSAMAGADGPRLGIEITESILLSDPDAAAAILNELRTSGVAISIDDFGTGYSSLRYLHSLPADVLKIDRSFVERCDEAAGIELVRTIVLLAERLGLQTVAEGIESEALAHALEGTGATHAQGFLFSAALQESDAGRFLATHGHTPA